MTIRNKYLDKLWRICVIFFVTKIDFAEPTIDIYDHFGRKIDSFQDREATFDDDDFMPMEGYVVAADPIDACSHIAPPTFLTNFTIGKFVLINGTETCGFTKKVVDAQEAGYDLAIIFDPFPMPFEFLRVVSYPRIEINIQVVFISFMDGISLKENYLYNNSYAYNFRIKIRPNTPDITYYMYLFGAVIGVCFFVMLLFMMCLLIKCIQDRRKRRRNRLSSRQIKQIPTTKFSKGDQYDVCAICLEDYNEGDKLRLLPCSHAYHAKCIDPWLMNNRRNCPLCKRKITFGDSGDDSDSEDSELTSPAENTPLLTSPAHQDRSVITEWGTFAINPVHTTFNNQESASSLPCQSFLPGTSQSFCADEETLLPPQRLSVNGAVSNPRVATVQVDVTTDESTNNRRGLIV